LVEKRGFFGLSEFVSVCVERGKKFSKNLIFALTPLHIWLKKPFCHRAHRGHRKIKKDPLDYVSTQQYSCVVIPDFVDVGGPWNVLPPGVHDATLKEVEARFATSDHRKRLFSGFRRGVIALRKAGCRKIFLDGSFVTEKPIPGDFDACWDPMGVDSTKLDSVLLDFNDRRKKQKECFQGEFFQANLLADGEHFFFDFFQIDRHTGNAKGIIRIRFSKN